MHKTDKKIFEEIAKERPYCERYELLRDHVCKGRSTMEHAWLYAGKQVNEKWAIIRLCYWSHLGPGMNKRINEWISLRHATAEDLEKYPKKSWWMIRRNLNKLYERV